MIGIIRTFRGYAYCIFSYFMTTDIYVTLNTILSENMDDGDTLIEVGPGTGNNLKYIKDTLIKKKASYTGIDYDSSYTKLLKKEVQCFNSHKIYHGKNEGDFLRYFGEDERFICKRGTMHLLLIECTMLMDFEKVKLKISGITKRHENIKIYFAHTEYPDDLHWLSKSFYDTVKPLLYYVTTMDFGRPTYAKEFKELIDTCNLKVEKELLINDIFNSSFGGKGVLKLYVTSPE